MKLNEKKTKQIIFNFNRDIQFTTDVKLKDESLEIDDEVKLKWDSNTNYLIKKANKNVWPNVWHSSLTKEAALKVILRNEYKDYEDALKESGLLSLEERREVIGLRFVKSSLKNPNFSKLFPLKEFKHTHVVRSVSIFFEFPPSADYEKSDFLYACKKLLCSFNSFVCSFKGFCTDKVYKL